MPFAVADWPTLLARVPFAGKWFARYGRSVSRSFLPPVVTGYLLLVCCAPRGTAGGHASELAWEFEIVFNWWGAVLASAVVSLPLSVRAVSRWV